MNKKTLVTIAVVVVAALAATTWWRQRSAAEAAKTPRANAAQTVTTVTVQQRDVPVTIEAAGTVVSLNTVEIRPQVSSTVREVAIREGQFVKRGDLLFRFDDRADRANLDKARAQLLRDRATLNDLQRQLQRAQELRAENFIAQSALDTVQAQLDAQQAAIASDQAAIQSAEVALSYGNIQSPLSGRAGAIAVYPGSLVQPSSTALVTISQIDPVGVTFTVPEAQLATVLGAARPGSAANAVPLSVSPPGGDRGPRTMSADTLKGTLSFVDNAVDTTTGTIRLKGTVPNPAQRLWPGQYVTVRMMLRTLPGVLVVPQAALIQRGTERSVYVVGDDGKAQLRPVQARYPFGDAIVVEGLEPGMRVVVEGKQNLRPGALVQEAPAAAARAGSAPASGTGR
ncbi:MAG: efflux RND transporter periplasmic adaptor subunit [Burkholderiales bacterium]